MDAEALPRLDATVVIPTLDGEAYLAAVLDALESQVFDGDFEVLVIDSGSRDGTLPIIRARPWVRLHEIPHAEFGHGRTRNLGARLARGKVVAFLTQDAIPAGPSWLSEISTPLASDVAPGAVLAIVGRQTPRARCFPLLKYEIQGIFAAQGPSDATTIYPHSGDTEDRRSFYSDVNSATLRELLLGEIGYRDVSYAEDIAFARDVLAAGYRKAYAGRADVVHSNDMNLAEYRMRMFEEIIALRRVGAATAEFGAVKMLAHIARGVLLDSVRIVRDPDYGFARTLYWLGLNPAFHWVRWRSYYRANRTGLGDQTAIDAASLEQHRQRRRSTQA